MISTMFWLVDKMKLAEPVSVFLEEDKHNNFSLKESPNFIVCLLFAVCVVIEQVTCYYVDWNIWQARQYFLEGHIDVLYC